MNFPHRVYNFMLSALDEANKAFEEEEIPIGSVIVLDNKIIGRGHNQVEHLNDPTAHAEMIAITAACNTLQSKFLNNCEIYSTSEPCIMCAGAIIHARINTVFFGAHEPKFGGANSLYNILGDKRLNNKIKIYSGIYSDEIKKLMSDFFQKKRKRN